MDSVNQIAWHFECKQQGVTCSISVRRRWLTWMALTFLNLLKVSVTTVQTVVKRQALYLPFSSSYTTLTAWADFHTHMLISPQTQANESKSTTTRWPPTFERRSTGWILIATLRHIIPFSSHKRLLTATATVIQPMGEVLNFPDIYQHQF